MNKDLAVYLFSVICIMIMLINYRRLNSIKIYFSLIVIYALIIYFIKLLILVKTKDFAPLITFVAIYHPIRYVIKVIIKREPVIYMNIVTLTENEKEKLSLFDYMFAPILLGLTFFISVFYFWDKL
jgi:hypothetical protein